jgi:hypothetical protein
MFRSVLEELRAHVSGERALADIREIARYHRIQSSPGYDSAAAWLAERLRAAGLRVEIEYAPGDGVSRRFGQLQPEGWSCASAVATLIDVETGAREPLADFAAEPLSVIQRSDPARGRFPLIALGDDDEPFAGVDPRGSVVLGRLPAHRMLDTAVRERGAAGLLCDWRRLAPPVRVDDTDVDSLAYTSFWWNGDEPRGWGFVVSPARGDELRARLRSGRRLEVEVTIDTRRYAARVPLITATIPGTGAPGEILVVSHLCHPHPGANDNASGAAANLECARALSALSRRRGGFARTVRFLWMPELTGTFAWLGAGDGTRHRSIVAALNLDMVGEDQMQCGSTLLLEHPPCFAASFAEDLIALVRSEARTWVTSFSGPGHFGMTRMAEVPYSGGSDHAVFVDPSIGVPCPMLIQWPDRFYHSNYDTPDRCDPESLRHAALSAATYAAFLAGATPEELRWLLSAVERSSLRGWLAALDAEDPAWATARQAMRGSTAIASLARLGVDPAEVAAAAGRFQRFTRENGAPAARTPKDAGDRRVPIRREPGPLDFLDHLIDGWRDLDAIERSSWRELRARHPDPLFEVAWFACDGRRTLDEIAFMAWLETGRHEPAGVAGFFEWTARLGRSEWRA